MIEHKHFFSANVVIGPIGFTAYATQHVIIENPPETVIFDGVLSNYGGAYDSTTGEFTCPVSGQKSLDQGFTQWRLKSLDDEILLCDIRFFHSFDLRFQTTNVVYFRHLHVCVEYSKQRWVCHAGAHCNRDKRLVGCVLRSG